MSFLVNLALGLLFGTGLVVSGMADPPEVLNFLDLFGTWNPSLAFVMGGAVVIAFISYRQNDTATRDDGLVAFKTSLYTRCKPVARPRAEGPIHFLL